MRCKTPRLKNKINCSYDSIIAKNRKRGKNFIKKGPGPESKKFFNRGINRTSDFYKEAATSLDKGEVAASC